ncbi:dehydrogenase [Rhizobium sp. AC44/96]|uniref:FAD-dependent oxidoreductase n=1 Tax=unclassified Rhizobium TaxID=2613769 RepID=UPI00081003B0|nr:MULTISPECIES: GMC family oxidoreductase [unclassified Rhizobium]MDM9622874.1 GMC family oxidoreductase [Rhizobium sp. S96]OCJ13226.1 dehydrogenase [Rhizobium sp. AC44/96]
MDGTIKPDVVIVGSGVGGGAVARQLAGSGAKVLILERGDFLPNEPENSDAEAVFVQARYRTREEYQDESGRRYRPGQYYYVGGHTKFYGTAMFRFRESDFRAVAHEDGTSPAWPLSYAELEPWYDAAERLFGVHGQVGEDPAEPPRSAEYAHAAVPHEPIIADMIDRLKGQGLRPFSMPSAVDFGPGGSCRRCGTCDAFACRYGAKGDGETRLIRPILAHPDVTLWTNAQVTRLIPASDGRIAAVEMVRDGQTLRVEAPLFVLSAGAINSALVLLRSASGNHPEGLANRSGVVGRYLMNHHLTGLMGLMPFRVNDTKFPKTLTVNDFYHGLPGDAAARGNIQMLGNIQGPMIRSTYSWMPRTLANLLGRHSVDWLCMSEDLPRAESRVRLLQGDRVEIAYHPGDVAAHDRFVRHVRARLRNIFPVVLRHSFGIEAPSHQCGTVRMGDDPARSALDALCRSHDHRNLYVVDASFFPSSAALNPALTVCAQALRVGAHLRDAWRNGTFAA